MGNNRNTVWIIVGIIAVLAAVAAVIHYKTELLEYMAEIKKKMEQKFRRSGEFVEFDEV